MEGNDEDEDLNFDLQLSRLNMSLTETGLEFTEEEDGRVIDEDVVDGVAEEDVAEEGIADEGATEGGVADEGAAEGGVAEGGVADEGAAEEGSAEARADEEGVAEVGVVAEGNEEPDSFMEIDNNSEADPDYVPPIERRGRGGSRGRGKGSGRRESRGRGKSRGRGQAAVMRGRSASAETVIRGRGRGRGTRVVRPSSPVAIWEKVAFAPPDVQWQDTIPEPPPDAPNKTPLDYFHVFIENDLFDMFVEQTNLYATQNGYNLNVTSIEMQQFVGILLYTGIANFPQYRMFWGMSTRFPPVADTMSRDRFNLILRYFHLVDNTTRVPGDRLFKVRPLINSIVEVCRQIPPEQNQSVDEHMIPFKGNSRLKQYVKKKPKKWGYKVFMRCSSTGLLHDFAVYVGKDTCADYNLGFSGDIVVDLCSDLPSNKNYQLFCDNWFSYIILFKNLKDRGIYATGVIRPDRTHNSPLLSEKELKEIGRGTHDYAVDTKNDLVAVRWFDNKQITMLSAIVGVDPVQNCKRWDKKNRQQIEVPRPAIVETYNQSMGGVDLFGMLIALYRVDVRSNRGYMRIVHWCFNVAVVNGWLLYRRHMLQVGQGVRYNLLRFQMYIAEGLCTKGSVPKKRGPGRPKQDTPPVTPKRGPKRKLPVMETRHDQVGHWPVPTPNKGRCAHCRKGQSRITCSKCNVSLCLTNTANCFF